MAERDELLESKDETISILLDQLREEREARRRADALLSQTMQSNTALNERLRELAADPEQRRASSSPPSVLRGSVEEGGEETARLLVGAIAGLVAASPSLLFTLISYLGNAPTLALLAGVFGILTGLVGTYFGIKSASDATEGAQRLAAEANTAAKQSKQKPGEEQREDG